MSCVFVIVQLRIRQCVAYIKYLHTYKHADLIPLQLIALSSVQSSLIKRVCILLLKDIMKYMKIKTFIDYINKKEE